MIQPYEVVVTVTKTCNYIIDANTSEEAESIAEQFIEEGEYGNEVFECIEDIDTNPASDYEEEEDRSFGFPATSFGTLV